MLDHKSAAAACVLASALAGTGGAQTTGLIPINDLGAGSYLTQYQGGLYPGGSNTMPVSHSAAGAVRAAEIAPLNPQGQPDPNGKFVFLSIGMSNAAQEFAGGNTSTHYQPWTFMGQAAAHPAVNHSTMVIFNGARGGQTAATWDSPADPNYSRVQQDLQHQGLSEAQVRAVWIKVANAGPNASLPHPQADATRLVGQFGEILRATKTRYPNLEVALLNSRTYAGYATTTLNPEPYAYEMAFAIKWVIEAQIKQALTGQIDPVAGDLGIGTAAPWADWGTYVWADGINPRGDGLVWLREDFVADGTHPSQLGQEKVGRLLMQHMLGSPHTNGWFLSHRPGDANLDGTVNLEDFNLLAANFGGSGDWTAGDFNHDGVVNLLDFNLLAGNFGLAAKGSDYPTPQDWANLGSAVPEPCFAGLVGVLTLAGARRRRRGAHLLTG